MTDNTALVDRPWRILLGNLSSSSSGRTYPTINPTDGTTIAHVPDCDESDVDAAVEVAQHGLAEWAALTPRERGEVLRQAANVLADAREELAQLDALDGGNPLAEMRKDVDRAVDYIRLMADYGAMLGGETLKVSRNGLHYTEREPYGVVLRITPYNHPAMFAASKVAAPLVAGNSVILKVAEQTPLSALRLGELWQDVFPHGVLSVLTGSGASVGAAAVQHPAIRRIAFTGSDTTGRAIVRDAAQHAVKRVSLELGGKNAMLVFPDANIDLLTRHLVDGMNLRSSGGQSCGSTSRIFVHESLYDEVLKRVSSSYADLRLGSPMDTQTDVGPMVSSAQMEKVLGFIEIAQKEGARIAAGGGRATRDGLENGFFVEPTVLCDIDRHSTAVQNEIFGPVVSIMPFKDEDDAVAAANGVQYGLTGSIWTESLAVAHRVARRLDTGYIWINGSSEHYLGAPFGGFKDSGVGREESLEEVLSYTEVKTVHVGSL